MKLILLTVLRTAALLHQVAKDLLLRAKRVVYHAQDARHTQGQVLL